MIMKDISLWKVENELGLHVTRSKEDRMCCVVTLICGDSERCCYCNYCEDPVRFMR